MKLIQLTLILGSIGAIVLYFRYFRSQLKDRLTALVLFILTLIAVLFPETVTWSAHVLGVGRGTDLIIYLLSLCFVFVSLLLYSKLSRLEQKQTELVRQLAIHSAKTPD
jgi:hypothetical protein